MVTPEQLGDKGRKVRCGSCQHVWFQEPPAPEVTKAVEDVKKEQEENLKKAVQNKAEGKAPSLPAVTKPVPAPNWLKAATVILIAFNFLLFLVLNKGIVGQTSFYDLIGQYDTANVTIQNVEFLEPIVEEDGTVYFVDWSIRNTSDLTKYLPVKRIILLDEELEVVKSNSDIKDMTLRPGQEFELKGSRIPNPDNKGRYLVLEVGNPFDLSLRRD